MNQSARRKTLLSFIIVILSSFSADATEIHLKKSCQCVSSIVRLGDVANVLDSDLQHKESLEKLDLFPAPVKLRALRISELQEILGLKGVNLVRCHFSGPRTVLIHGGTTIAEQQNISLTIAAAQRTRLRIEKAIASFLREHADPNSDWKIKVELSMNDLGLISKSGSRLLVKGGQQPWVGQQNFRVSLKTTQGEREIVIPANVTLPAMVVVVIQSLNSGDIIRAQHIQMLPASGRYQNRDLVHALDYVVGKEVVRAMSAGQPVDKKSIRPPLLVRRREIVTVYSRAAGVRVRTTAVAQEDGSLGELITVQSLDRKNRYAARVSKFQEVEVFAGGPAVASHHSK